MALPNSVKNLEIPQTLKNMELPNSVKNLELPNAVKDLPQAVRNLELPNVVKNIELPNAVKNIDLQNAVKSINDQLPTAVKNIELPSALKVFSTSALSSVASLTQIIQQKVDVIQQEHKEFVKQVKEESIEPNMGTVAVPPWEGLPNEDELKEKMLTLSKDKRNFLINPPENTNFQFDMNIYYQTATAVLHADPNLDRMRFELVPSQVQEPTFWRNYFYRISLIKQTALGSIDGVALENEVYSKNQEESAEETGATNTITSTEIKTEGKENNKDEESKEVLFDVEKSGDNSGAWMENKIVEVASEDVQVEEEGDEEAMEDWEEQMKKELEL